MLGDGHGPALVDAQVRLPQGSLDPQVIATAHAPQARALAVAFAVQLARAHQVQGALSESPDLAIVIHAVHEVLAARLVIHVHGHEQHALLRPGALHDHGVVRPPGDLISGPRRGEEQRWTEQQGQEGVHGVGRQVPSLPATRR